MNTKSKTISANEGILEILLLKIIINRAHCGTSPSETLRTLERIRHMITEMMVEGKND